MIPIHIIINLRSRAYFLSQLLLFTLICLCVFFSFITAIIIAAELFLMPLSRRWTKKTKKKTCVRLLYTAAIMSHARIRNVVWYTRERSWVWRDDLTCGGSTSRGNLKMTRADWLGFEVFYLAGILFAFI